MEWSSALVVIILISCVTKIVLELLDGFKKEMEWNYRIKCECGIKCECKHCKDSYKSSEEEE